MTIGGTWADRRGVPLTFGSRLLQGIDAVVSYVLITQSIPESLRPRVFGPTPGTDRSSS